MAIAGPFQIDIGFTFQQSFVYKSGDDPIDLTGYTAEMHIRAGIDDVTPLVELTSANGRIILGGTAGTIELLIPHADTAPLSPTKKAGFDLKLTSPTGIAALFVEGYIEIKKRNTR